MANILAIVGRPNVGKSTLFNRLVEQRVAITDDVSGVTRDRHYGQAQWNGIEFTAIDTGGYVEGSGDVFEASIRSQVLKALQEASAILFVVDCIAGINPLDEEFALVLHRTNKPVFLVANKADHSRRDHEAQEFYSLGFENLHPISAANGAGTGDLLDEVVKVFENVPQVDPHEGLPKIAILGRPNAGKSSMLNLLLGVDRAIVTDIAGTTRDTLHEVYDHYGKKFVLTDTAGIRKKSKVDESIEFYAIMRAIRALEESDVCIIMVDATRGVQAQDMGIIHLANRRKKGIVLVLNKWDLVEKDSKTAVTMEKELRDKLKPLDFIPIFFASVVTKQRVFKIVEKAMDIFESKTTKVPTSKLNEYLLKDIEAYPPPAIKGKYIRIKYITQLPSKSPTFAFFCNLPQYVKDPYMRYLENKIRAHFGFEGVPITVVFRKK